MYQVIVAKSVHELERDVDNAIEKDWDAIGGLCIIQTGLNEWLFFQAMIKQDQPAPKVKRATGVKK